MSVHLFRPDFTLGADHNGEYRCTCGMPQRWRGHDVPETPPEATAIDARILGEGNEEPASKDSA